MGRLRRTNGVVDLTLVTRLGKYLSNKCVYVCAGRLELNNDCLKNMASMSVTLDTSHFENHR